LPIALNHFAFKNPSANLGQIAFDLGNIYRVCGKPNANGSALFRLLVLPPNDPSPETGLTESGLADTERELDRLAGQLASASSPANDCTADEFRNAIEMLRLCIAVGREKLNFKPTIRPDPQKVITEHRRLWLARNRPGGLEDSVARITAGTASL
jgi:hexosaminidase